MQWRRRTEDISEWIVDKVYLLLIYLVADSLILISQNEMFVVILITHSLVLLFSDELNEVHLLIHTYQLLKKIIVLLKLLFQSSIEHLRTTASQKMSIVPTLSLFVCLIPFLNADWFFEDEHGFLVEQYELLVL